MKSKRRCENEECKCSIYGGMFYIDPWGSNAQYVIELGRVLGLL